MSQQIKSISGMALMAVVWLFGLPTPSPAAEVLARLTVQAGDHLRIDTPVSAALDGIEITRPAELRLREVASDGAVPRPCQIELGNPPRLWWILAGTTQPGASRSFELVRGDGESSAAALSTAAPSATASSAAALSAAALNATASSAAALSTAALSTAASSAAASSAAALGDRVRLVKTEEDVSLLCKDRPVLRYRHAPMTPPAGASERYTRSAFIHPLWSPQGAILTDIHPRDHIHHMGIWFPWTSTEFEGRHVDFWNLNEGQGTVRFVKYLDTVSGPVYGGFQSQQEHVALKTDAGEKVVLREVWDVRVFNVGGPEGGYWLCDFRSVQKNVADSPLHLNEYRYGGFGFRGSPDWRGEKGAYLTSEGKTRKDANATRSRWCEVGGVTPSGWSGVVFMSHPDNHEHPEPMRIWPGENDLVFFGFVPAQKKAWDLLPGRDYTFRYRWYVHEGKIDPETAERVWTDFGYPPTVTVEK